MLGVPLKCIGTEMVKSGRSMEISADDDVGGTGSAGRTGSSDIMDDTGIHSLMYLLQFRAC